MFSDHRIPRRDFLKLGLGAAAAASMAQLLPAGALAADNITLTYWKAPHTDRELDVWKEIIEKYKTVQPNVTIQHTVTPWASWDEQYTTAFASGSPPDVLYLVDSFAPKFIAAGQLVDFDAAGYSDQVKAEYDPTLWDIIPVYRGVHYGIPFLGVPQFLFYNKTMFDQAGISKPPDTWDEFVAAAQELTRDGKYGFVFPSSDAFAFQWFLQWLWSAGGEFLSPDGTSAAFNSEHGVEALQFVVDWYNKYKIVPAHGLYNVEQSEDLFNRGGVAMAVNRVLVVAKFQKDFPDLNWGVALPPAGPHGDRHFFADWGYFGISQASKNKDAAWDWIKFITAKEQVTTYLSQTTLFPVRTDVTFLQGQPTWELFAANASMAKNTPLHPKISEVARLFWVEAERAILGQTSAKEALDAAAEQVNPILQSA